MNHWTRRPSPPARRQLVQVLLAALLPAAAHAQGGYTLERIDVTGSAVRRIDAQSALPIQVVTREDIERSGASSVTELLRRLPVLQGGVHDSASLGGQTYGYSSVAIHNYGDVRTLVLLNGHRLASFGGQTLSGFAAAFDINALPLSAVERIDILTDGASTMYGADAVAGVVNVITRRDTNEGDVTVGFTSPRGGGFEKRLSVTQGIGSLSETGRNLFLAFSSERRDELLASDRSYARSGQIDFTGDDGRRYRTRQLSTAGIPGNVYDIVGGAYVLRNPALLAGGACPANHYRVTSGADDYCGYDYASTVQLSPERQRDSFMASWTAQVAPRQELFADVLLTRSTTTTRSAPALAQLLIDPSSPVYAARLAPLGFTDPTYADYRLGDLGQRSSRDVADFGDIAVGARGIVGPWDYRVTLSHSESRVKSDIAGYVGGAAVNARVNSGALDPFVGIGQQTPAGLAALRSLDYRGYWDGGTSKLDTVSLRTSREFGRLDGGPMVLGVGVDLQRERLRTEPSAFAQGLLSDPVTGAPVDAANPADLRSDAALPTVPYAVSRRSRGVYAELVIPADNQFELSLAARHDRYSDFGKATTVKTAFRLAPTADFLIRGSLGTGFHAPSTSQTTAPQQSYGVTAGFQDCTPALAAEAARLGAVCRPDGSQYDVVSGGNASLRAERSLQATLGTRFEPSRDFGIGADLWFLRVTDSIGQLTEDVVFADPARYSSSFVRVRNPVTGVDYIGYSAANLNLGRQYASGIDFDVSGRWRASIGELRSRITLTHLLREDSQLQPGGTYYSAIGNFAELGSVSFRWIARWATSLRVGDWTHSLAINARSGYRDREETVQPIDAAGNPTGPEQGYRLKVKRYATADWQTEWQLRKQWRLTAGVLNVFDTHPPLSIASTGVNKGQMAGYDDRYYDPRGRAFYVNASYKF